MTEDERAVRIATHLVAESLRPGAYFWLSFVDVSDPENPRSSGATIVKAPGPVSALREAHRLGVNPGGDVRCFEIPADAPDRDKTISVMLNKLLSKEEIRAAGIKLG